ncbi:PDZ domain-containing protein [Gramella jeungdoensis]|uniref:Tricorn protease homolog n=2 Tax=Gramella jeungdoensis TaxID=708091 RepID=A0ABT0YZG5_9FLAO|nr:S41 family peptidase [Gramella jeungdoensis]MCM8568863.1 PDZ domain-containing protein [Gramella jeungdoensis]
MKRLSLLALVTFIFIFTTNAQNQGINTEDTRLLWQPAISDSKIAFIYAEDLWVANRDGSNPKRLTVDEGIERDPVFSPDGKTIAFSAEYDGNTDVFVVPTEGGIPKRLTWHPYPDIVRDFTPDGKKVLFLSQRDVFTNRYAKLYNVDIEKGNVEPLKIPHANWADYNSDGSFIAYTPLGDRFNQWKNYRGGTATRIWIYDPETYEISEIPKPEGGSNDSKPQWLNEKVYFRSDRDGEFNIYSYDPASKQVTKHTNFEDFPVTNLSAGKDQIIFSQAGYLHTLDPATGNTSRIKIGIATDLLELRPRFVKGDQYVRSHGLSPTAARVVMDYRGDILTFPAEKGDPMNITATPGVHEKYPAWSPDGKTIAYFSDESGEYALHLYDQNESKPVKKVELDGAGFYAYPEWAPDSKKIAFVDNSRSLYIYDLDKNNTTKVASDVLYTPGVFREMFGDWSHDSKWITYTIITDTNFEQAFVYSLDENKSYPVSDGYSNVMDPEFDPSGKYLYMLASTDAGPVVNWFDQSNQDMEMSSSLYLVTLQKDVVSPFFKENDVEVIQKEEEEEKKKKRAEEEDKEPDTPPLKIDFEDLEYRIVDIPVSAGVYRGLEAPKEGQLYYLKFSHHANGPGELRKYDLKEKKDTLIMPASGYEISANGEKVLYEVQGKTGIAILGQKPDKPALNLGSVEIKIDPKAEWQNIFHEAWRVNRDYFYDPGMHGADWDRMKEKYSQFLPHVTTRSDLYEVMEWMFSELGVGHHRFSSRGDEFETSENIKGGLLGADFEVDKGRYKIKKIYGGLNWNPEMRSPLTEPGVNVNEGDYILAVDGKEVTASDNLYMFFENTANKIVTITVSSSPNMNNSRKEKVIPVESERDLRNRDWIEGNIKKVNEATNGQVAYVYVPNTANAGHEYFKRYFFPQADRKAIIIDERFNGGGQLADYYIDMLKKPQQAYWNFRYGKDLKSPSASIQGPKVMLIDETAGSGGDYLPWMFRKFNLGTIIGKRTWGGLVGVLGYPEFIDGGIVTAPNVAFYTEEGFRVENEGVPPDIEVEQLPKEVIKGNDPQLQKAIEVVMEQLKENPPKEVETPPYPIRGNN